MEEKRIYGKSVEIEEDRTRDFYDNRAENMEILGNPYVSVLLGDQNPEYAMLWNEYEKNSILPKLAIDLESCVLDIGCGMGRWAEMLIPDSKYYCGVDMSAKMIERAKERNNFRKKNYDFYNHSFTEFCQLPPEKLKYKFNRIVMCGVAMYINDVALAEGLTLLLNKLDTKVRVYFTETEYNQFYEEWVKQGFVIKEQGLLPHLNKETEYRETERWYTILERN